MGMRMDWLKSTTIVEKTPLVGPAHGPPTLPSQFAKVIKQMA